MAAEIERLRGRVRARLEELRARVPLRGSTQGQIQLGKGALLEKAKTMVRTVSARVEEVRPRIVPVVKEYRVGAKLEQLMGQGFKGFRGDVYHPATGQSIEDTGVKPYDRREAAIEL